ncbi:hypothetical protein BST27_21285 [Mycobacterium intermedium]|uniref:Anti-sigma-D factor RsdA sigma factor binding region domain-containing protein n=1 Tax=Mycobacterium intermedium TaxID=28445 RepID=A0A1E3SMN5_MYCIE|nr:anti-sigma-D factor RsdA [Mycobacterium intermedium]MCV6963401.1 hypothetical protein [Mycobacterium intermedium]ODR02798.1 hypothetical protein BHQ20_02260 [Mycobacterium intermedium]OPE46986.1 hypothetical protein BV508_23815 [Mycobacterium intermedium]ORA98138.1 hypothetical protein BST27_21285 [Mycobacterium intermedium]
MHNSGRNSGRNFEPDFGSRSDPPALDELTHTDLLLDALAERADVRLGDPDDDALATLLGEWRDDVRWPPANTLVLKDQAIAALEDGLAERRRTRRGMAAVGSVAATVLALSGFGAVVADARPGDALYGLHAMLFSEPRVNDDQIELSAKAELAKVEQMIAQGQWDQAHTQLAEVSSTLQGVNDDNRKQNLLNEVNQLNTKVDRRDPNAQAPQTAPLVPPSAPQSTPTSVPTVSPTTTPQDGVTLSTTPSPSASPSSPSTTPGTTESEPPPSATEPSDSTTPAPTTTSKSRHRSHKSSETPTEPPAEPTP